jgi:hypothetical protein
MSFRSFDLYNLVNDYGQTATLRKTTSGGNYNPATGEVDAAETTDYTVTLYFYNYDRGVIANVDDVRRGTRKCVISAVGLTVEPDDEDQLVGVDDTVNITRVTVIYSGTTKLCYICDVSE